MLHYIWIRLYLKPITARIRSHTCTGTRIIFAKAQLLHCSARWGSWAHKHIQSRRTARWPQNCVTELQPWPAGLTTRQICTEANPEQPLSPPRRITMLPISTLQEAVRRGQACQVLQFSLRTAHKPARCCHFTCSFLYPQSSYLFLKVCLWPPAEIPPFQLLKGLSSPSRPLSSLQGHHTISLPQVLFLSPRRHKHAQDLG